jgi:hypothetical protein
MHNKIDLTITSARCHQNDTTQKLSYLPSQVQQYCFVDSASACKAKDVEPMHVEGYERKSSASRKKVEDYFE